MLSRLFPSCTSRLCHQNCVTDSVQTVYENLEDKEEQKREAILKKEQAIERLITECLLSGTELDGQLMVKSGNPSDLLNARNWFLSRKRIIKNNWFKLRTDKVDMLTSIKYLDSFSQQSKIWMSLNDTSKENLLRWQKMANEAVEEMILLRNLTQEPARKRSRRLTRCLRVS